MGEIDGDEAVEGEADDAGISLRMVDVHSWPPLDEVANTVRSAVPHTFRMRGHCMFLTQPSLLWKCASADRLAVIESRWSITIFRRRPRRAEGDWSDDKGHQASRLE